jgi:hypothetical protein
VNDVDNKKNILGILGGILVVVGTFLPWERALGVTFTGMTGSGGVLVIILGALIAVFALIGKKWSNIVGLLVALGTGALIVARITDINSYSDIPEMDAGIGFGLWIVLAGAVLGLIGCGMAAFKRSAHEPIVATTVAS